RARGGDRGCRTRLTGGRARAGPHAALGEGGALSVPEEELYGVSANGKMYVIGGYGGAGQPPPAVVWEYDPGPDKWTRKKNLPVAVHHQAQTVMNGKIYFFGGCQRPVSGPGVNGWAPVDNAWEYDPMADTYKALAPLPGKRCSAIAE